MNFDLGEYRIKKDERQFIIQSKRIVEEGKRTKEENIGKEVYKNLAYYTTFKGAVKYLSNRIILDNNDINTVINKLNSLEKKIESLNNEPKFEEYIKPINKEDREYFKNKIKEIKENKSDYSRGYLVEDIFPEAECISEKIIDQSRWSVTKIQIYEYKGMYLEACWQDPATEMQEGQDTYLEIREVKPIKKEILDFEGEE